MNFKNFTLIIISLFLFIYVVYFVVEELKSSAQISCESESCVRFCAGSNTNVTLNSIKNDSFSDLSLSYALISDECKDKIDFSRDIKDWKFLKVILVNT